jgi:hypothetical protein
MDIRGIRGLQVRRQSLDVALGRQRAPAAGRRRVTSTAAALYFALLLLVGCAPSATIAPTPTATPTTPVTVLPAFADWRVAYLGLDGTLHAVSLDGKTGVAGPKLTGLDQPGLNIGEAHASPDGRFIAYPNDTGMTVVALAGALASSDPLRYVSGLTYDLAWSPDGTMLALSDRGMQSFQTAQIPLPANVARADLLGWIDAGRLAVTVSFIGATGLQFAALDIATGKLRVIMSLPSAGIGSPQWSLSPDGKQALLANGPFRDEPYTPFVETINTTTGLVHKLPNTLKATSSAFNGVAWRPGTTMVAVTTGSIASPDPGSVSTLKLWLVDTQRDMATQIPHADQLAPKGAYPLGWASDTGPLIVNDIPICCLSNNKTAELRAITISANGGATSVKLTDTAVTFPWLGLVKTA